MNFLNMDKQVFSNAKYQNYNLKICGQSIDQNTFNSTTNDIESNNENSFLK
jgi:hypothetical protein